MSHEIYFLRHGESSANVFGILCGRTDVKLTPTGKAQVKATAYACDLHFDHIITSPLKRAQESAEIVAQFYPQALLQTAHELVEQDYGQWEGKPFSEVKHEFLNTLNPPQGETHQAFTTRLQTLAQKLKSTPGRILLVSHGGVGSHLMAEFGLPKRLINNAEMVKLYAKL